MKPLIEITTVPIQIEMKTTNAKLEYARGTVEMEISRDKGGLNIKSRPIRVNIDTFEARNSITPTLARSLEQGAQKGQQAAYQATATYAQQGKLMMETKLGEEVITKFSRESLMKNVKDVGLTFLPSTGPEITWDVGEMNIRYEMDKLNFDWKFGEGDFKFTPGDIELTVTQRPEVIIKYIGGPIYVPPSSDPNYEPVDVRG
ncbi:MAG: hypothetical protein HFF68_03070 [Oscillospiraceae bacterium]|jgi:hypothetical protein|nr:hypothetical protein [Oscillospiraceae bacterium]MCI8714381.1 hypothetical protein [Oscillospiraceae bacterium]MCI9316568.1 hypothetical protein [Oscillospiraceae bacterium]MDE6935704.1 hypothetical protein [Oscillospiraceae bacterium]